MTCIAAIAEGGKVYMGADSATMQGWDLRPSGWGKILKTDHYIIGSCGDAKIQSLLRYRVIYPEPDSELDRFMATDFLDALRTAFKDAGYMKIENSVEGMGGSLVVGCRGRLYEVSSDLCVLPTADGLSAVGCGGQTALAVMWVLKERPPEERIKQALEAAEYFSAGVRAPFTVEAL